MRLRFVALPSRRLCVLASIVLHEPTNCHSPVGLLDRECIGLFNHESPTDILRIIYSAVIGTLPRPSPHVRRWKEQKTRMAFFLCCSSASKGMRSRFVAVSSTRLCAVLCRTSRVLLCYGRVVVRSRIRWHFNCISTTVV